MDSQSIISALDAEIANLQEVRALLATSGKLDGSITRKATKKAIAKQRHGSELRMLSESGGRRLRS